MLQDLLMDKYYKKYNKFPLRKYHFDINELINNIHSTTYTLQEHNKDLKYIKYLDKYLYFDGKYIEINTGEYQDAQSISDIFTEELRIRASKCITEKDIKNRYDRNVYNYWCNNYRRIIDECYNKHKKVTKYLLRESLYYKTKIFECTSFDPMLLMFFINMYNSKKILDPFAGWGGRLIGTVLSSVDPRNNCNKDDYYYYGIDLNEQLQQPYNEMIEYFTKKYNLNPNNFNFKYGDSSDNNLFSELINESFDMIFTSPPYYDFEYYFNSQEYPSLNNWVNNVLIKSFENCIPKLKLNGYMVININNSRRDEFLLSFLEHFRHHTNLIYIGCITQNAQPFWIFQKIASRNITYENNVLSYTCANDDDNQIVLSESAKIINSTLNITTLKTDKWTNQMFMAFNYGGNINEVENINEDNN